MFKEMASFANLMRHAQSMPAKLQEVNARLSDEQIVRAGGDGAVTVTANGLGQIESVRIAPEAAEAERAGELGQAVRDAVNEVNQEAKQRFANAMHELAGDLDVPALQETLRHFVGGGG